MSDQQQTDRREVANNLRSLARLYDIEVTAIVTNADVVPFKTVRWLKRNARALREVIVLLESKQQGIEYALAFLTTAHDQLDWYRISPKVVTL